MDTKTINELFGITESYKAPETLMNLLLGDAKQREKKFKQFLEVEWRVDQDWFHEYFQDEHADRKMKKQDFTPNSIGKLLSRLLDPGIGSNLDVAAGTGGLTIIKWDADRKETTPLDYYPNDYFYQCEELSDRSIPFLLFNLMIRGMNATVLHGDSLGREVKQIYFVQNEKNDFMGFSSLNIMLHSKDVERMFNVRKWLEEPIDHIESKELPEHLSFIKQEVMANHD